MLQLMGASLLAGIGFTMSIFVAQLSFGDNETLLNVAKAGVLAGSLVAGVAGYIWLFIAGSPSRRATNALAESLDSARGSDANAHAGTTDAKHRADTIVHGGLEGNG